MNFYARNTWCLAPLCGAALLWGPIARSAAAPGYLWGRNAAEAGGYSAATSLAVAREGFVVMAGWFDSAEFQVIDWRVFGFGEGDIVLMRLSDQDEASASGLPRNDWVEVAGGSAERDQAFGVAVDLAGEIYMTGTIGREARFGFLTVTNVVGTSADAFLAKYSSNGDLRWVQRFGGELSDQGNGVAIDGDGNCVVVGEFSGSMPIGVTNLMSRGDSSDIFVAKFSPQGTLLWVRQGGGQSSDSGAGVGTDRLNQIYITGSFRGEASFGLHLATSRGEADCFVAKLSPDGAFEWVRTGGGTQPDQGYALSVTDDGTVAVTGTAGSSAQFGEMLSTTAGAASSPFVARYDSAGNVQWVRRVVDAADPIATGAGRALQHDPAGNIYVTGHMNAPQVIIGGTTQLGHGGDDVFVVRLSPDGGGHWQRWSGGDQHDLGLAIGVAMPEEIFVAGQFASSHLELDEHTLVSEIEQDSLWIANLGESKVTLERTGGAQLPNGASISMVARLFNRPRAHADRIQIYDQETLVYERGVPGMESTPTEGEPFVTSFTWDDPPLGHHVLQARSATARSPTQAIEVTGRPSGFQELSGLVTRPERPTSNDDILFGATLVVSNGTTVIFGPLRVRLLVNTTLWRHRLAPTELAEFRTNEFLADFVGTLPSLGPGEVWRIAVNTNLDQASLVCPKWYFPDENSCQYAVQSHVVALLEQLDDGVWRLVDSTKLVSSVPSDLCPDTGPIYRDPLPRESGAFGQLTRLTVLGPASVLSKTGPRYAAEGIFESAPTSRFLMPVQWSFEPANIPEVRLSQSTIRFTNTNSKVSSYTEAQLIVVASPVPTNLVLVARFTNVINNFEARQALRVIDSAMASIRLNWGETDGTGWPPLILSGPPIDQEVRVLISSNLLQWTEWRTNRLTNVGNVIIAPEPLIRPRQFYRAVVQ